MRSMASLILTLAACAAAFTPGEAKSQPAPDSRRPNVVIVTLDTVRADRIGAYGYADAETEAIDALANRGRLYTRAYSTAPLTIPAHASLFTGKYPATLGITKNGVGLSPAETSWITRLSETGYRSAASVGAFVVGKMWGFDQGFDDYFDDLEPDLGEDLWPSQRRGSAVVDDILRWKADQTASPLLVWVHLYDAHTWSYPDESGPSYDRQLQEVDRQVGRLVRAFEGEPTLFLIVGDHGESLGEHNEETHGYYVYNSTQHIPLILSGPGIPNDKIDEVVSLVDIGPTVLDYLGLPPLDDAHGRVAPGSPPKPIFMEAHTLRHHLELATQRAIVEGRYKWVDVPDPELYDLMEDPDESHNLIKSKPDIAARLSRHAQPELAPEPDNLDAQSSLMLEELGYVASQFTNPVSELPDAKLHQALIAGLASVTKQIKRGQFDSALKRTDALLAQYPDLRTLHITRADLLLKLGQFRDAEAILAKQRRSDPNNPMLKYRHAKLMANMGQHYAAGDAFQEVASDLPFAQSIREAAIRAFGRTPRGNAIAIRLGLEYLRDDPDNANLAGLVGLALLRNAEMERARPWLEKGSQTQTPEQYVCFELARIRHALGRDDEARALVEREVAAFPLGYVPVLTLGMLMAENREWEGQLALIAPVLTVATAARAKTVNQQVSAGRPQADLGPLWHLKAQALMELGRYEEAVEAVETGLLASPDSTLIDLKGELRRRR